MIDYSTMMGELEEMRSRFDKGFSSPDRERIVFLYSSLLGKTVRRRGCSDCYRDAYIEIYTYLKRLGHMPKKSNYSLKPGIIVHPQGTNKFYANNNIPDDVAEEYLAKFPANIIEFASYPADYLARVEARKNGNSIDSVDADTLLASYKELKAEHEKTVAELEQAKAELEAATTSDDGTSTIEIETLKSDLTAAQEENAKLKAELDALKGGGSIAPEDTTAAEDGTDSTKAAKKTKKGAASE